MDAEKLEDAITHLELALDKMKTHRQECSDFMVTTDIDYSIALMNETLDILRNFELREEIDRFSGE